MKKAFERFCGSWKKSDSSRFQRFLTAQDYWLEDFALFCVLTDKFGTRNWSNWPPGIRKRRPSVLSKLREDHRAELDYIKFLQFKFFSQWSRFKTYLNNRGIGLIGDIPLFVGYRSSDIWVAQQYFQLNRDGSLRCVAGVPPDYYLTTAARNRPAADTIDATCCATVGDMRRSSPDFSPVFYCSGQWHA